MSELPSRIWVAGHRGMAGSAIVRALQARGCENLITRSHAELDLTDQAAVRAFFRDEKPDWVFLAAAKVGGIHANNVYRAQFIYENLAIETNVIHEAYRTGVQRLLFLGSNCIYPKFAAQPIREDALLTGALELTNQPYAIAKIAGIELCDAYHRQYGVDFRAAMPSNLYGPGDNFNLENSHVLPALLRKFHEAKEAHAPQVTVWGTGTPRREFLHVDDLASACVHLMLLPRAEWERNVRTPHVNVGTGEDITIAQLAKMLGEVIEYRGELRFDTTKPDGTPRKLLDVSLLRSLGWAPRVDLAEGLRMTYRWFTEHIEARRA